MSQPHRTCLRRDLLLAALLAVVVGCNQSPETPGVPPAPLKPAPPVLVITHPEAGLLSVIDTTGGQVSSTIPVPGTAGPVVVTGDGTRALVSVRDAVAVVSLAERRVERTLPAPGEHAGLTATGDRLFVVQNPHTKGRVLAIDVTTGRAAGEQEIDDLARTPEVSRDGKQLYVPHSFYSGRVTILDAPRLRVRTSLSFEDGATRARLSTDERTLLVPNGSTFDGRVTVVDVNAPSMRVDIGLGAQPTDLVVGPDGQRAVVTLFSDHALAVIDLEARRVARTIPVGEYPLRLALSPDGQTAYVIHNASNRLSVVDLRTGSAVVHELQAEVGDIAAPSRIDR
jgi:YVTN family beta-propeller protein